ncbi:putative oxidoreductase [Gordonia araii NBRC 100433]|uniref:Putative oxidoreductase n=1 Tax=Gordonia araii NBRC 100433 TaxID=1073574 RepID=G7H5Q2_9ACTN|nr:flavin reductase family protein [Gordonia araii]NNG95889.1 flavin reductase family protein [Gordonia araii NBRC 100433]GAB11177.1 putative oxidoreductase [Gordonia araii NBRC 100433]
MSAPTTAPTDPAVLRRAFAHFPSGLVAVAALSPAGPIGLLVSSFTSVSLDPALVSVSIGRSSSTLPHLRDQTHWGISILAEDQESLAEQFRRPAAERFADIGWSSTLDGAVHLHGAAAGFTTRLDRLIPAGDHSIALLEVVDHFAAEANNPLLFHRSRFHRIVREGLA